MILKISNLKETVITDSLSKNLILQIKCTIRVQNDVLSCPNRVKNNKMTSCIGK
jgi:hypothetical protein